MKRLALLALLATPALHATDKPAWHTPRDGFRLLDHTWYVGTEAITVLLLRGDAGAILIDTGVPKSAESVLANIRAAGVDPQDIEIILTSHAHLDHVGAIAQLKALTGATVLATAESRALLERGGKADLHFGDEITYPPLTVDATIADGHVVRLGELAVTAHATPGHTPGSTSWTWNDAIEGKSVRVAYVDSVTAPGYELTEPLLAEFATGFAKIRGLPCDVLITPHPEASKLFERSAAQTLVDDTACSAYAERGASALEAQAKQAR